MNIVVILPTYNERENISTVLHGLHSYAKTVKNTDIKYVVVDDSSPDGTAEVVRDFIQEHPDTFLVTGKKEGLGRALLRGMTYAVDTLHADYIMQMDADMSHDPKHIVDFIGTLGRNADFVVGSRYIRGGSIPSNWGFHRKLFSVLGNAIVRFGLGVPKVHDWTGGFRAYDRKYFDLARKEMESYSGYVFQIAFLHKAVKRGALVAEVPIHFTDRKFGHSKIAPMEYIKNVLYYVFSHRFHELKNGPLGKLLVVGGIGFVINTILLVLLARAGVHPAIASALGAECAIISNFILNNNWTFKQRSITGNKLAGKFIQFNGTSLGALGLQSGTVWLGTAIFGKQWYFPFYMLGVGIGLIWNFTMYSKVIWRKK